MSCHDQGTSVKQGCAGAPGGGSPGTLERANVAGVRESVVAVASQLIEMAAQPDDPAGGRMAAPISLPEPDTTSRDKLSAEGFPARRQVAACGRKGLSCPLAGQGVDLLSATGMLPERVLCGQAAGSWLAMA